MTCAGRIGGGGCLWLLLHRLLLFLLLLHLLLHVRARGGAAEGLRIDRQVAQERDAGTRHGEVARRLRLVGRRLLEQDARLIQVRLRRDPLAIADLVDRVRARRLLRRAAARREGGLRLLQLVERDAGVERRELVGLLQPEMAESVNFRSVWPVTDFTISASMV